MSGCTLRLVVVRTRGVAVRPAAGGVLGCGPTRTRTVVEIAVRRHQLAVPQRQMASPRYTPTDRMLLAALAKLLLRDL